MLGVSITTTYLVNSLKFSRIIPIKLLTLIMRNILLLHGALGTAKDLEKLAIALSGKGVKTHLFSFSGHSKTEFRDTFGIEQFSQELGEYINNQKLRDVELFGYSMGGYVALYYALHNGSVSKVITLGTKFNWNEETVKKETGMLNPDILEEKVPAFASSLAAKHGVNWKELVGKTAQMMWDIKHKNFIHPLNLNRINSKVLIGLADNDQMVTLDESFNIYKSIPKAQMYMLPGTRHSFETVNVDLLTSIIVSE